MRSILANVIAVAILSLIISGVSYLRQRNKPRK